MDIVAAVGQWVERLTAENPTAARHVLEAAYGWVALSGSLKGARTYAQAVDHFNGAIASTIIDTLRHPQDSVLVNIFMPPELLAALHVRPMFPEVLSIYVGNTACSGCFAEIAEGNNVPESFCSYHKVMVGMAESGVLPAPALIANTTLACDANQVSFRRLAERYDVPHFVVDVPRAQTEASVDFVEARLYELIAVMEDALGRRFDEDAFREACARSNRTLRTMAEYRRLRGSVSLPTSMTGELMELIATHLMLGTTAADDYANALLKIAKTAERRDVEGSASARADVTRTGGTRTGGRSGKGHAPASAGQRPRIYWMHTLPNWQHALRDILDGPAARCELVGNDMTFDSRMTIDLNDPMRSLARRIVENHFNGAGRRRVDATLRMAKEAAADGVVVFCHWGCKQTLGLSQLAKRTFEEAGLPTLVLDGDGCDGRNVADGQMVTRLNAFLEQLKARKIAEGENVRPQGGAA